MSNYSSDSNIDIFSIFSFKSILLNFFNSFLSDSLYIKFLIAINLYAL